MAVPKRRLSRSNTRHRRSQWKASLPTLVTCVNPACRAKHLPHVACPSCGQYGPRAARRQVPPPDPSEPVATRLPAGDLLTELGMSVDPELLDRALTHRSYAYEQGGLPTNERLEFLGDSVLGLVVTEHLFVSYPDLSEGQLAKLRAAVVNSRALADVARDLDLGAVVHLGRGEESTGGRDKSSILADTMEAMIGAVFLQHGIDAARDFVHHLFDGLMADVATRGAGLDWKTSLQEIRLDRRLRRAVLRGGRVGSRPRQDLLRPWCTSMTSATGRGPGATRRKPSRTPPPWPLRP